MIGNSSFSRIIENSLFSRLLSRRVKEEARQLIIAIRNSSFSRNINNSLFSMLFGRGVKDDPKELIRHFECRMPGDHTNGITFYFTRHL